MGRLKICPLTRHGFSLLPLPQMTALMRCVLLFVCWSERRETDVMSLSWMAQVWDSRGAFKFPFYDTIYTRVFIDANGALHFRNQFDRPCCDVNSQGIITACHFA